jgi:hypothetical protein
VAVKPVIDALDSELDSVFDALGDAATPTTLDVLKEARQKVVQLKTEFDPKDLAETLISTKTRSRVPTTEASQVFKTLTKPSTSREGLVRTLKTLEKAPNGRQAIQNLQASVVFQALEDSLQAVSNRSGGRQQFSPAAFNRSLNKFGDKLDIIFRNNKGGLKELRDLQRSAQEAVTPATTKPKGSAPAVNAILDFFGPLSKAPLVRPVIESVAQGRQVRKALRPEVQQRAAVEYISSEFPALASVLGVAAVTENEDGG